MTWTKNASERPARQGGTFDSTLICGFFASFVPIRFIVRLIVRLDIFRPANLVGRRKKIGAGQLRRAVFGISVE